MDSVTQTTAQASAASTSPTVGSAASSVISSDFETFLQMLTAQARYQDPMEPMDSSEYSAQLAQFSSVEQQVMTNDLLSAMVSQLGGSEMAQVAGWIGMEARTNEPVYFDGSSIQVSPKPVEGADDAKLVVYNEAGEEVQRINIPLTSDPYHWDGTDDDGDSLGHGVYSFKVESFAKGQILTDARAETYSRITEARTENGQTVLILNGGASVTSTAVTALREAA